jgi:hypothetical protein
LGVSGRKGRDRVLTGLRLAVVDVFEVAVPLSFASVGEREDGVESDEEENEEDDDEDVVA